MPDYSGFVRTAYVRTASTAVGAYEYIRMFPTVVDFYVAQWRKRKISVALVLLMLLRVTSITLLVTSDYALFHGDFTYESCSNYYLIVPTLRVLQVMISQCIMGVRAYNLSGRWKPMAVFLLALYASVVLLQCFSTFRNHRPSFVAFDTTVAGLKSSCLLAAIEHGFGSWVFYAVAIVYDTAVTIICAYYLLKYKRMVTATFLSKVMNAMIYDGLVYFVGLTAINTVNLILVQLPGVSNQKNAVSVSFVLVWILSQYIVLSQHRAQGSRDSSEHVNISPYFHSNPEAGPSTMPQETYLDTTERHGEAENAEVIQMKELEGGKDESDRVAALT